MIIAILMIEGPWDWIARLFGKKLPPFDSFMNRFVFLVSDFIFHCAVTAI